MGVMTQVVTGVDEAQTPNALAHLKRLGKRPRCGNYLVGGRLVHPGHFFGDGAKNRNAAN